MKNRVSVLVFLLLVSAGILSAARYRFDYDMISDVRKRVFVFFKFRLYYHASASAYFRSRRRNSVQEFRFAGIPESGYRTRTHKQGERLSVVTAAYSFSAARNTFGKRIAAFRREAPFYSAMLKNNKIACRPYKIISRSGTALRFTRFPDGSYGRFAFGLRMVKPRTMEPYAQSFNIYRLLLKMVEMMGTRAYPGKGIGSLPSSGRSWKSPWLNYGQLIERISFLADHKGKKYFDYRQKHAFVMRYRVISRKNGRIVIVGSGRPNVGIGMGMNIIHVSRKLVVKIGDGTIISEFFRMQAKNPDNLGWTFKARLRRL